MYNYIEGKIDYITANSITIDNHGIGYNINVPNPYAYKEGEVYKVYTYHHMSEYDQALYGFKNFK